MPDFDIVYKLHSRCSIALVYVGNTYQPRWYDSAEDGPRYDAHIVTTWKFAKAIVNLFADVAADKLYGLEGLQAQEVTPILA